MRTAALLAASAMGATACGAANVANPCDPIDPVLADAAFVAVVEPRSGARVSSPFEVRGCSRTFESNVVWRLTARDGRTLASGHTSGGGVSGAAAYSFSVAYRIAEAEVGRLVVFEPDASDGEGFPPGRSEIALVLLTDAE